MIIKKLKSIQKPFCYIFFFSMKLHIQFESGMPLFQCTLIHHHQDKKNFLFFLSLSSSNITCYIFKIADSVFPQRCFFNCLVQSATVNNEFWSEQKVFVVKEDTTNKENTFPAVSSSVHNRRASLS